MKQRASELRAQEKIGKNRVAGEEAIRMVIAEMTEADQSLTEHIRKAAGK